MPSRCNKTTKWKKTSKRFTLVVIFSLLFFFSVRFVVRTFDERRRKAFWVVCNAHFVYSHLSISVRAQDIWACAHERSIERATFPYASALIGCRCRCFCCCWRCWCCFCRCHHTQTHIIVVISIYCVNVIVSICIAHSMISCIFNICLVESNGFCLSSQTVRYKI